MVDPGFGSAPQPEPPRGNGLAVAGLVLGILALVLCWIPFLNWILAILAIVFGAVGLSKARRVERGKGFAIAGLALGAAGAVLGTVVFVVTMSVVHTYIAKSRSYEARMQLDAIAVNAQMSYEDDNQFPQGTAPLTPAGPCCGQPDDKCRSSAADWTNPVWKKLEFSLEDPTRYRFSYESTGPRSFVARAVADFDCDGHETTYEVRGSVVDGVPQTNLIVPPGTH